MTTERKQDSKGRNLYLKLDNKLGVALPSQVSAKLTIPALLLKKAVKILGLTLRNNSHAKSS